MAGEKRYLGIGEEATFGTEQAATAYLDYLRASLEAPSEPLLYYEGAGGRGQGVAVAGPYVPSGDLEVGLDVVEAIYLLKWALGRYGEEGTDASPPSTTLATSASKGDTSITVDAEAGFAVGDYVQIDAGIGASVVKIQVLDGGAGPTYTWTLEAVTPILNDHASGVAVKKVVSPFKHIFRPTLDENLPSFTAHIGKNVFEHTFMGCTINSLSFSVERGFLTARASVLAQQDKKNVLDATAKAFGQSFLHFRLASTLLAAADVSSLVESFSLELSNNIDENAGVRHGSRFPVEFPVQGVDVSGSLRLAFANMDEYTRFWGMAGGPQEGGASAFKLEEKFVSGTDILSFIMGSVYWTQISTPVSGRDRITQELPFKAIVDAVWDLITVEVTNNKERY